jgi:transcriptional regulator with XRE-family HTH domain
VALGLSQDDLAQHLGVERSTVVRWEAGKTGPRPYLRPILAEALRVTVDQLDDLLCAAAEGDIEDVHRREFTGLATGIALSRLIRPRFGSRIGMSEVRQLLHRTARLRRLDDHLGGMDTYDVYASEMKATAKLAKDAGYSSATSRALMGILAEQTQMAGWAAFDAGRQADARRHYRDALTAAQESRDPGLVGNTLAFMAYEKADVEIATASCEAVGTAVTPRVRALLQERRAWTHAVAGDADKADRALSEAIEAIADTQAGASEPDWVFWVDEIEVQIMAGRCWTELRRPDRAVGTLESALGRYDDTHARDKALYSTWLAHAYLDASEVEQAATVVDHAMDIAAGVGSVRPGARIATVMRRLREHRRLPAVAAVLDRTRG